MSDYIYVRKCEFVGKDSGNYYWFYQTDENDNMFNKHKSMPEVMSKQLENLGYSFLKSKYSKIKIVEKASIELKLMKLKRKTKIKERFKKFLKDESLWFSYWMNFRNNIHNKINDPEEYINLAFSWYSCKFCSMAVWCELDKKWKDILKNEFNYNI